MTQRSQTYSALSRCSRILVSLLIASSLVTECQPAGIASSPQKDKSSSRISLGGQPAAIESVTVSQRVVKGADKLAEVRTKFVINAPPETVWQVLTDFAEYPHMFRRLESCRVTKQEGHLVWTESDLKPHVFVRTQRQHTINDLSGKPSVLDWKVIDGNFKTVIGKWELSPIDKGNRCAVIYTLAVDTGPIIPKFLVSFALKNFQKEIGTALKQFVETTKVSSKPQPSL